MQRGQTYCTDGEVVETRRQIFSVYPERMLDRSATVGTRGRGKGRRHGELMTAVEGGGWGRKCEVWPGKIPGNFQGIAI